MATRVQNRHDIEDLCQEIFYIATRNIGSLRNREKIVSWLYGIAANVVKRYYHRKYHRKSAEFKESTVIDRNEDITDIRLILGKIPDRLRVIYELHYVKNRKIREIARLQNLPEGTVKYYLFDLRKRMKKELDEMQGREETV
ncbi:MAG: RNA polymerase sigma factor [Spirochaetales bacterium]|nr:RNA polymerase sigma factor [Spirochaetales bacterium]